MHAPVSPLNSRAALKTNVHLFPVVLHLLGSSSFKNKMVTQQILTQLANLTKLVEASFQVSSYNFAMPFSYYSLHCLILLLTMFYDTVNFDKDILVQFLCHVISLQGRDDFRITLLQVLECITEDAPLVTQNAEITIREILPSLATIYNENNKDGDDRFLCLKIWFDTVTIFLTECTKIEQQTSDDLKSISNSHFLPLYPALIQYQLYAQKLLVMLVEL